MVRIKRLLLVGAITVPAAAFTFGGWAVVTVDDLPEYAVAGRAMDLTYTVRQHGMTPRGDLTTRVDVSSGEQAASVVAEPLGAGRYRARVALPTAGTWKMRIESGWGPVGGDLLPMTVIGANAPVPAPMTAYARGHQLYMAKGCATCHSHQLTKDVMNVKSGPDLSEPKFTSAYLARFLANPAIKTDWKSDQRMPNLRLKPAEIAALTAFLNQEKGR